VKTVHK